jgi:hypothetical protein
VRAVIQRTIQRLASEVSKEVLSAPVEHCSSVEAEPELSLASGERAIVKPLECAPQAINLL